MGDSSDAGRLNEIVNHVKSHKFCCVICEDAEVFRDFCFSFFMAFFIGFCVYLYSDFLI